MTLPNLDLVPHEHRDRLIEAIHRSLRSFPFFCRFWLGFDPHPKQVQFARAVNTVQACGSGFGKSVGGSAVFLWDGWRNDQHAYAAFAPTNRQVKFIAEDIAQHILRGNNKFALFIKKKPTLEDPFIELTNGTRLWLLNTAYGAENNRGIEVNGVWLDEAAMIKPEAFELAKTRARLTPGRLRMSSTPKGRVGWFFEQAIAFGEEEKRAAAEGRSPRAQFIQAASEDNPHYDRQILADRKATTPDRYWRQEYMGEFVDVEGATFRQSDLDRVFDARWEPETSPRAGGFYAHGWDFGQVNYTVGTTLAFDRQEGVYGEVRGIEQEEHRGEKWGRIYEQVDLREARWGENDASSETIIDYTGIGRVIEESLTVSPEQFVFTKQSRAEMLQRLTHAVEKDGRLRLPRHWTHLYASMQLHTANEDAPGQTWDHLDSIGLAYWLACERSFYSSVFGRV